MGLIRIFINFIIFKFSFNLLEDKKNNKKINSIKFIFLLTIFNIFYLLPFAGIIKVLYVITMILVISSIFVIIYIYVLHKLSKREEFLKKLISSKSYIYNELKSSILSDNFFIIKTVIILSLFLFLYHLLITLFFLLIGLNLKYFLQINLLLLLFDFLFFSFLIILFRIFYKDKDLMFSLKVYISNIKIKIYIYFILIFLFGLLSFFLLSIFLKNRFYLNILGSYIISLFCSFLFSIILNKISFYNSIGWIKFTNILKNFFEKYKVFIILKSVFDYFIKIKIIYLLFFSILFFVIQIFIINKFYYLDFKICLILSLIIINFFTYPMLKSIQKKIDEYKFLNIFKFTCLLFVIIFSFVYLSKIHIEINKNNQFYLFLYPITNFINLIFKTIFDFLINLNYLLIILIPALFLITIFLIKFINDLFSIFKDKYDKKIFRILFDEKKIILFSSSNSLYPIFFNILLNLILIIFLLLENMSFSELLLNILTSLQVASVFKLDFINAKNINTFVSFLIYISIIFMLLKLLLQIISNMLSSLILLEDELIYYENKIFKSLIIRVPLSAINCVVVKQNIIEKIFMIGSIFIELNSTKEMIIIRSVTNIIQKNKIMLHRIKNAL
jgi:hypothetical protein